MPQISCVIPTLNRPHLLARTLTRLFETTQGIEVEAVVVIDESFETLEFCVDFAKTHTLMIDYSPVRRGAIYCWNLGLKHSRSDIFFHMGDDLDFEDGWLRNALAAHQEKLQGYGLVGVNDQMHNAQETVATHFLFDRKFCKEVMGGIMANPKFRYYNVDAWATAKAKQSGRFYWAKDAIIRHIHPSNNLRPVDDTDRSHGDAEWNYDIPLFEQMKGGGLKIDFEPVI